MKKRMIILFMALLSLSVTSKAQWAVIDPTNLAQSIVNSANEIVQTSTTAQNMWSNFQETVKIYQQGKAYYDALKSVHDLVKGARKVQQTILLVGDISDIYVTNFNTMMGDPKCWNTRTSPGIIPARISEYRTCAARRRGTPKGYSPCTAHTNSVTGNHSS